MDEVVFPIRVLSPEQRERAVRDYQTVYSRPILRNRQMMIGLLLLLFTVFTYCYKLARNTVRKHGWPLCTLAFSVALFQGIAFPQFVDLLFTVAVACFLAFALNGFALIVSDELAAAQLRQGVPPKN